MTTVTKLTKLESARAWLDYHICDGIGTVSTAAQVIIGIENHYSAGWQGFPADWSPENDSV